MSLQPQALRFERDRAAATERVEQRWRVALGRRQDQLARSPDHTLVSRAFPLYQGFDELK